MAAVVLACFAIGLGAALPPVGEPLGTIAIAALKADFWSLARLLGPLVVTGIVIVGILSLFLPAKYGHSLKADAHTENWSEIFFRAGKVYLFVAVVVGRSGGVGAPGARPIAPLPPGGWMFVVSLCARG